MKNILGIYAYLRGKHYAFKISIHINNNIDVGEGLCIVQGDIHKYLFHWTYFTCFQIITVSTNREGILRIKNDVTILPGVVVVEEIILNNNRQVETNSYVDKNVGKNTIVSGFTAKLI